MTIAQTAHRRPRAIRRAGVARRLGLVPTAQDVVRDWLDAALPAGGASALDAGCGRVSQLRPFRNRIGRFVGVDIHRPARPLAWLDQFQVADVCTDADAFPAETFDLALSSFTVEHFANPRAAFRNIHGWLRPGAWLVLTTVNRAHPFVNAYLSLPRNLRGKAQQLIKAGAADAHPLVGACNTPSEMRAGLRDAGFVDLELVTTDHLSRAWARTLPAWALGLAGDLAAHSMPSRRSTIVARGRKASAGSAAWSMAPSLAAVAAS